MDRLTSCCFTGHRNLTRDEMVRAAGEIGKLLPRLIDRGITDFYAGGALGFDYAASVTVINSKRLYPELTLNLALPCRGHTKNWSEADRLMFGRMAARAIRSFMSATDMRRDVCRSATGIWLTEARCACAGSPRRLGGRIIPSDMPGGWGLR